MEEKSKGITSQDLMDVLNGQKEVGNKYKSHFFSMFAQMFCIMAEEVIKEFGDDGRKVVEKAVKKYGEERGKRIANLVKSLGKELNLKNFFIYSDLDSKNTLKYKIKLIDGNIEIIGRDCVFYQGCKEWDKLEFGRIYCDHIDKSILRGYNPDLKIEVPSTLTSGGKKCILRYLAQ